jgi:hypothetical protein
MMLRVAHLARFRQFCCAVLASAPLLATTALVAAPAQAQTAQQLSPGQAVTLTDPGVELRPLSDGRLASYGAETNIEGVAFTNQAGSGATAVTAAAGVQLVVLHVYTSWDLGDIDEQAGNPLDTSLSIHSGNLTAPLQVASDNYPSPDDEYYAAAVPAGAPAWLELSVAGLVPQTFDLRSGQRVGTSPAVLYRAPSTPAVTVRSTALSTFSGTTPPRTATGQFGVATAYLAYWQPYSTTLAPDPDHAYLDVEFADSNLSIPGYNPGDASPTEALPAGSVQFRLPDGRTVAATSNVDPTQLKDIFSGDYYALVPADTTQVQVLVTLTGLPVQVPSGDGYHQTNLTLTVSQPLTVSITLPAATPASPAASANPGSPSRSAVVPPAHRSGSGFGPLLAVVLVAIAVALLAISFLLLRRRRYESLPAVPVRWPPAGLPRGAVLLLERGPVGALPAADVPGPPPGPAGRAEDASVPPPAVGGPRLMVLVLGPPEVEGLTQPVRRRSVRRLLLSLALTPDRPLTADELAMAISDHPERDPKPASVHSYASMLRRSLPTGVFPEATARGYQLDHRFLAVDWAVVARVAEMPSGGPGWAAQAADALGLVRGRPLDGDRWDGIEPLVRLMQATIERLARHLVIHQLDAGDPAGAENAAARGLSALPGSVGLWEDRLSAAAAGSGYGLQRAWTDAQAVLGPDAALLAHHFRRLQAELGQEPSPA